MSDVLPLRPVNESSRRFLFQTQRDEGRGEDAHTFQVVQMRGEEGISRLFRFEILLSSTDPKIDLQDMLSLDATLVIRPPRRNDTPVHYHGCLAEFEQLHQANDRLYFYRAVLVPHVWRLSQYRHSNVYLGQAIDTIIAGILKDQGKLFDQSNNPGQADAPAGFALWLQKDAEGTRYNKRDYVCQYEESPLDFISRWMEKEGIYYYFEHDQRKTDLLVLLDDKIAQDLRDFRAEYTPAGQQGAQQSHNAVQGFICRTRPVIDGVELREFDDRQAGKELQRQEQVPAQDTPSADDYPGNRRNIEMRYGDNARNPMNGTGKDATMLPQEGLRDEPARYARVRFEDRIGGARVYYGESTAVGLRSGRCMRLDGHFREHPDSRYLITEITHEGSQLDVVAAGAHLGRAGIAAREGTYYRNSFVALPAATQFRAPLRTPRPQVAGTMSARIDAGEDGDQAKAREDAGTAAYKGAIEAAVMKAKASVAAGKKAHETAEADKKRAVDAAYAANAAKDGDASDRAERMERAKKATEKERELRDELAYRTNRATELEQAQTSLAQKVTDKKTDQLTPQEDALNKRGDNAKKKAEADYDAIAPDLDDQGRYHVRLPFDANERAPDAGSARVRFASPYAGAKEGLHLPLHKGTEVLLSFLGGDPDQPVIVAAVPNAAHPNVVNKANRNVNRLLSRGGNEILLDDSKSGQAIWMYSPAQTSVLGLGKLDGADTLYADKFDEKESKDADKTHEEDVSSGTGILLATKGKIQQIQKTSESSFWGTSFSAKVGNTTSASASFDTKINWGASVGISGSTDVKWSMDMLPNPIPMVSGNPTGAWKDAAKFLRMNSVSISDSSSVKFSKQSDELVAIEGVSLVAGGVPDANWWTVKAYERVIKTATAAYVTAVLTCQSILSKDVEKRAAKGGAYKALNAIQPVSTVAFIAGLQGWARQMAAKLGDLKLSSRVEVDKLGVRLAVNAPGRDESAKASASTAARAEVNVYATGSVEIKAASSDKWLDAKETLASTATFAQGLVRVAAGFGIELEAPTLTLGPADGKGALVHISQGDGTAEIKSDKTTVKVGNASLTAVSDKVEIGTGQMIVNVPVEAMRAQCDAAYQVWWTQHKLAIAAVDAERRSDLPDKTALEAATATAMEAEATAIKAYTSARRRALEAALTKTVQVMVGLTVDQRSTTIAGGGASAKTSSQGVELSFGSSALRVNAQGVEHAGPLIKIG